MHDRRRRDLEPGDDEPDDDGPRHAEAHGTELHDGETRAVAPDRARSDDTDDDTDDDPVADRRSVALDDALDTMATLEPAAAQVVVLWLVHELSVAEICSITAHAPDRVRELVRSGVAQLRSRAAPRP